MCTEGECYGQSYLPIRPILLTDNQLAEHLQQMIIHFVNMG